MKLILATTNKHKISEIKDILASVGGKATQLQILTSADIHAHDVVEDADTFQGNAIKKATEIYRLYATQTRDPRYIVLADDSGLEVYGLQGKPGVHSARYAGEPVDYSKNIAKLLDVLKNHSHTSVGRIARLRCIMATIYGAGVQVHEGAIMGTIAMAPRGTNGFGYDPVFQLDNGKTLAELSMAEKNQLSHRGQALRLALSYIISLL